MNKYFLFFYTLSFLILFSSCKKEVETKTDFFEYYNEFFISEENKELGSLQLFAEIELPIQYKNKEILSSLQKQIVGKVLGEKYNNYPLNNILNAYAADISDEYRRANADFIEKIQELEGSKAFLNNQIEVYGMFIHIDDKIMTYSYERYAYMGGAHGNSRRLLFTFDLDEARILTEEDVFKEGYEQDLTQLIKEAIVDAKADLASVADLDDFNFFSDQIKPNNNFYVMPEGIIYLFNPYDIAPYSMGETTAFIPYTKLKGILKPNNGIEHIFISNK